MYQGNYDSRDKKTSSRDKGTARFRWRKEFVLLVSVFVMIAGVVGGTIAYLTSHAEITNNFTIAHVDCEVKGSNGTYTVQNTSDIPAYIRAAVVVTWQKDGNVYGVPVNYTVTPGEGWEKGNGDYYYYEPALDANGEQNSVTSALTVDTSDTAPEDGCKLKIEILAEAIQSQPETARQEAWINQ